MNDQLNEYEFNKLARKPACFLFFVGRLREPAAFFLVAARAINKNQFS